MPYQLSATDKIELGAALAAYYDEALEDGYKALFDKVARANMGMVTGYLDQGKDTYLGLRKKSKDAFGAKFNSAFKQHVSLFFANKNDVAGVMVTLGEKALGQLAKSIPVPILSSIVSSAITFAAAKAQAELHERSIVEADSGLKKQTGSEVAALYTNDTDAAVLVTKAMEQYKLVCSYIMTLPANITTFDDAVTFPSATFKVQAAASSLNVALVQIMGYLTAMQSRMQNVSTVVDGYKKVIRETMPGAVEQVLQKAYLDARESGTMDIGRNKYNIVPLPVLKKASLPGGATQLAAFLAHAIAQGYYDAGNVGPNTTRPRAVGGAPLPPPRR